MRPPHEADISRKEYQIMAFNLKNRHLLSLAHHSTEEIKFLVGLAADLKEAKYCGTEQPLLKGKNIALIFEKA